jgi:hypothetical protein
MVARVADLKRSREAMSASRRQIRANVARPPQRPVGGQPPDMTGLAPLIAPLFGMGGPSMTQRRTEDNIGQQTTLGGVRKKKRNPLDPFQGEDEAAYPPELGVMGSQQANPWMPESAGGSVYPQMPMPAPRFGMGMQPQQNFGPQPRRTQRDI